MKTTNKRFEQSHKHFCDFEIAKANRKRFITQRKQIVQGIKTSGKSKAMLALELASLF